MSDSENLEAETRPIRNLRAGQSVFGRYTLERKLGQGGMGSVWLAKDEELDVFVALKFIAEAFAYDPEAVADLKKETKRGFQLTHPSIVRILNFLQDSEHVAIAMEYVDGDTLSRLKLNQPGGCFDVEQIRGWICQLCEVLTYAHEEARVVHRDLKPANLMVTAQGRLKVLDFGISRSLSDSMTLKTLRSAVGLTPGFSSPQQIMGKDPSAADDIYALGATIYDLLTGKPPFYRGGITGLTAQIVEEKAPPMAERRIERAITGKESIPNHWERLVMTCLAKEPEARPTHASDVTMRLATEETTLPLAGGSGRGGKRGISSASPSVKSAGDSRSRPWTRRKLKLLGWALLIGAAGWLAASNLEWSKVASALRSPFTDSEARKTGSTGTVAIPEDSPTTSSQTRDQNAAEATTDGVSGAANDTVPERVSDQQKIEEFKSDVYRRIEAADNGIWSKDLKAEARAQVRQLTELFRLVTVRFERRNELTDSVKREISTAVGNDVIKEVLEKKTAMIVVLGYADTAGSRQMNAALSQSRADSVKKYLSQTVGIKQKINAFGIGGTAVLTQEMPPVNENPAVESSGKENRAVEIWIAVRRSSLDPKPPDPR